MNNISIEKLNSLRERNLILTQDEFERIFKGSETGRLKIDQVIEFVQYRIGGTVFDLKDLRWVKGRGERYLKATLDFNNGYVKRDVYLNDNTCYPAVYADQWQAFKEEKLALLQPLEDNAQTVITLENVESGATALPVEVF